MPSGKASQDPCTRQSSQNLGQSIYKASKRDGQADPPEAGVRQLSDKQEKKLTNSASQNTKSQLPKRTERPATPGVSASCVTSSPNGGMSCSPGDEGQMAAPSDSLSPVQPEAGNRKEGKYPKDPTSQSQWSLQEGTVLHGARGELPLRPQHPESCRFPTVILPRCKLVFSF
jgi:hypothetical protein